MTDRFKEVRPGDRAQRLRKLAARIDGLEVEIVALKKRARRAGDDQALAALNAQHAQLTELRRELAGLRPERP